MRIAYACYWDIFSRDGVTAKIATQMAAWRAAGHDVELFCLSRAPQRDAMPVLAGEAFLFRSIPGRVRATRRLMRAVTQLHPDFVYLRYDLFAPPPVSLLNRFASAVEVNTDDRLELRARVPQARVYNLYNRRRLLGNATGLVCVTHELARSAAGFEKPTAVIANGVELDGRRVLAPNRCNRPTLVFLAGADVPWQGVDKVLSLAAAMPECDFVIIGAGAGHLSSMIPHNVTVHGVLARAEYEPILARSDVALGTLALHRKGMGEACPLKVREYLACGLPVVIGYEDTDFIGAEPWFLLRIPNTECNVRDHTEDIRAFIRRVHGRRVPREAIVDVVGAHVKETTRLDFLSRLAAEWRGSG